MNQSRFENIEKRIARTWDEILETSPLVRAIREGEFSPELYMIYMLETYQYTAHNARNQALVAIEHPQNPVYMKFCLEHAADEAGHELMAWHDLCSIAPHDAAFDPPQPLPATEALIAYLYWVAKNGNPVRRLGYSFWAESSYQYINPLVARVKERLKLKESQLTFFIAHSSIDEAHAREVRTIMERVAKTDADWDSIGEVAETSLRLTGRMLDAIFYEYEALMKGGPSRYSTARSILFSNVE